jgi:hypothetical protein
MAAAMMKLTPGLLIAQINPSVSDGLGAVSIGVSGGIGVVIVLIAASGIASSVWGALRWTGGWRRAALIPTVLLVLVTTMGVYDAARNPTSYFLVPFSLLLGGIVAAPYMLVVTIVRRIRRRAALSGPPRRRG